MPFRAHPELAKYFRDLPTSTGAACLLHDSNITDRQAMIEILEHLAQKAGYLSPDTCAVCHTYKAVIHPAVSP